jgi:transcription termination/antitermination protein NusG
MAKVSKKVESIVELTWEEKYPYAWYCIACGSAAEARVALHLRKYCEMLEWDDLYDSYLIPMETVMSVSSGGERTVKKERLYAGYLLVRVRLTPDFRNLVLATSGVQGILGDRTGTPVVIPQSQIDLVVALMIEAETNRDNVRRKPKMSKGTSVVIVHGSFQNFSGTVQEHTGTRVIVRVNIFGRSANVSFLEDIVVAQDTLLQSSSGW